MTTGDKKGKSAEEWAQFAVGVVTWLFLMWVDSQADRALVDLSATEVSILLGKYAFAAILIKGVTVKELTELLRAWKGKNE